MRSASSRPSSNQRASPSPDLVGDLDKSQQEQARPRKIRDRHDLPPREREPRLWIEHPASTSRNAWLAEKFHAFASSVGAVLRVLARVARYRASAAAGYCAGEKYEIFDCTRCRRRAWPGRMHACRPERGLKQTLNQAAAETGQALGERRRGHRRRRRTKRRSDRRRDERRRQLSRQRDRRQRSTRRNGARRL